MNEKILINRLPVRTWNRLGVNAAEIEWNSGSGAAQQTEEIAAHADGAPIRLDVTDGGGSEQTFSVTAREGSHVTVFECCTAKEPQLVRLTLDIAKGASVRLVQLLNPDCGAALRHEIQAECADGGSFDIISVMLGSGDIYSDTRTELIGDKSSFSTEVAYLVRSCDTVDCNIAVNHYGKSTESRINAAGAIADSGKKIFRGTIDFKNGSADSVGCENETVLMLGENAVNKTVPLILCAEENVEGTHGASIGELDADTLFYFESRGISKAAAEQIMARAAIDRLIGMTGDSAFADSAAAALGEVLDCCNDGRDKQ